VCGNRQGRDQDQTEERDQAHDGLEDLRPHPIKESDVQGQKVAGVPHEQSGHKPKEQPLQATETALAQDQHHKEEMEQRPKGVNDQFVRY
jgi:hypothetical protein